MSLASAEDDLALHGITSAAVARVGHAMTHAAPVLIDFESRSRCDLKTRGGRHYWLDASSEALCCVWFDTRDDEVGVWTPRDAWPHAGRTLAAHNAAGFDRFAAERYGFAAAGWIDTAQLARKAGLPGALDALGVRWCGVPKDKEASRFTRSLSSVRRPRWIPADVWRDMPDGVRRANGVQPTLDAAGFERVVRYCLADVEILALSWPRLAEWIDVDAEVEALDATINARGVAFDVDLARVLLDADARLCDDAVAESAAVLGLTHDETAAAARSPAQFCAIAGTDDATSATVDALLAAPAPPHVHAIASARRAIASITAGKLAAGLARVHDDGRLRDTLRYYGAHTGRWSSQGMQLHNLTRPAARFEGVDVDAYAREALAGVLDAEEIALLLRATVCASPGRVLVVRDFSAVEARGTAWAAGDHDALDVFASGRDPYKVAAAHIFAVSYDDVTKGERQVGKVAELACGFGGGRAAFERFAALYRIELTFDVGAAVDAWRDLHRPIVALWHDVERAFRSAARGVSRWAGPFEFVPNDAGDAVACFLPSGRPIVYNAPSVDGRDIAYVGTRGREHVYGGKLVENAVQAFCRDLLCDALTRAEAAGLNPVLHVHDEIVCDLPRDAAREGERELAHIMSTPPGWAKTFPLKADGWTGERYRK